MAVEFGTRNQVFRVINEQTFNSVIEHINDAMALSGAHDPRDIDALRNHLSAAVQDLRAQFPYRGDELYST